jgi:hypothetical protein
MHYCKSGDPLEDFHERELENFRSAVQHPELALAQAMRYCADEDICPPPRVIKDAADLICNLLLHQKCNQRGRNAGFIGRYRQDYWDLERWDAVLEVRRIRKRVMTNLKLLRRALQCSERILKAEMKKAKSSNDARLQCLQRDVDYHRRQIFHEEKWIPWFKHGTFECASRYLVGRDARIGAHAMRSSYQRVQRALADPVERTRYSIFEERFLKHFGFPNLLERKSGTKSFPLYSITN